MPQFSIRQSFFPSQPARLFRHIHNTSIILAKKKKAEEPASASDASTDAELLLDKDENEQQLEYHKWATEVKNAMANTIGPFWLGKKQPFPTNPEFRPNPPLSEISRIKIYDTYLSDPKEWTPRRLSEKFKVSIPRVEAIIKLKRHEQEMIKKGFNINSEYVKKMDQCLGSTPVLVKDSHPRQNRNPISKLKPIFVAIPEHTTLTPQDAANIIGRPLVRPSSTESAQEEIEQELEANSILPETIRVDHYEKSRHTFAFTDIGADIKTKRQAVLIREPTGQLRLATATERRREASRIASGKLLSHSTRHRN